MHDMYLTVRVTPERVHSSLLQYGMLWQDGQLVRNNSSFSTTQPSCIADTVCTGPCCVGSLPATWAKLTRMQELGLSNNMLTGAVPIGWSHNLSFLDLSGNQQMCGQLHGLPANMTLQVCMLYLHHSHLPFKSVFAAKYALQ